MKTYKHTNNNGDRIKRSGYLKKDAERMQKKYVKKHAEIGKLIKPNQRFYKSNGQSYLKIMAIADNWVTCRWAGYAPFCKLKKELIELIEKLNLLNEQI